MTYYLSLSFQEKARLSQELEVECSKRATLDAEVTKLRSLVETSEASLVYEKGLVTQLQQEMSQLKVFSFLALFNFPLMYNIKCLKLYEKIIM